MNRPPMLEISDPAVTWSPDNAPYSGRFGDVYFSTEDGLAESRHVFLKGIGAPQIWAGRRRFSIGETGFGSGRNFLATWAAWQRSASPDAVLSYVAVEGFPLSLEQMARALAPFSDVHDLARQLVDNYPDPHPGFHQITFAGGRVRLLLLFGPVEEMLAALVGLMDAWYLDGFSPQKNPAMWSDEVLATVAKLSNPGARVATFTAASRVRRTLEQVGFDVEKTPGYGQKRECLRGTFKGPSAPSKLAPWFDIPTPLGANARIAIIGAGVAGGALAHALKPMGAKVTVYDRHPQPAGGASGNPVGLLQPRPADPRQPYARFQTDAYLHTLRVLEELAKDHAVWKGTRGVISVARDDGFLDRYLTWVREGALPEKHARTLSPAETEALSGVPVGGPSVFFPTAGSIDPAAVCRALLTDTDCKFGVTVTGLRAVDAGWQLIDADGAIIAVAEAVVLANGVDAKDLSPACDLALHAKRGQVSFVKATAQSRQQKVGLSYGGYATAAVGDGGGHVLGATYDVCDDWSDLSWRDLKAQDHQQNLDLLAARSPVLAGLFGETITGGRASLRTTTADHAPVIGPLFNDADYEAAYGDLRHGKPRERYPSAADLTGVPGLYVLTAFGSRGFALATLAADVLVAEMFGLPVPMEKSVIESVHPARFLVRSLKRR